MNPNRPKQHVHNWKLQTARPSKWIDISEVKEEGAWKKYSPGGFYIDRWWACIRGNKVKHTMIIPYVNFETKKIIQEKRVFVAASGVYPERI